MNSIFGKFHELISQQFTGFSFIIFLLLAAIGVLAAYVAIALYERKRGSKVGQVKKVGLYLLIVYLSFLFQLTYYRREPGSRFGIATSLKDIFLFRQDIREMVYQLLNVILFLPFGGLLMVVLKDIRAWRRLVIVISSSYLCSLIIEVTQLLSRRGYFEVTDLLMNVLGGAVGCLIAATLIKIRK